MGDPGIHGKFFLACTGIHGCVLLWTEIVAKLTQNERTWEHMENMAHCEKNGVMHWNTLDTLGYTGNFFGTHRIHRKFFLDTHSLKVYTRSAGM